MRRDVPSVNLSAAGAGAGGAGATALAPAEQYPERDAHPPSEPDPASVGLAPGPPPATPRKKWFALVLIVLVGIGVALYAFNRWQSGQVYVTTDDAQIESTIFPIRSRVSGLVERVAVADNDAAAAGGLLVQMRDVEAVQRVREAEAESSAMLLAAGKGGMPGQLDSQARAAQASTTAAQASIEQTRANLVNARSDYDRASRLAAQKMATTEAVDQARARVEALEHAVEAAQSTTQAAYQGALAQQAQLRTQDFRIEAARARLVIAQLQLSDTRLFAPRAGVVSRKNVEPGQFVVAGQQLMEMTDTRDVWVIANVKETDVGRVHAGQSVRVVVDAYPDSTFKGTVQSVEAATGAKFSLLPQDNAAGNFIKVVQRVPVKIVLKRDAVPRLLPGMSAFVEIRAPAHG
jgi:membrane fusion protein (multidrug efflux system)